MSEYQSIMTEVDGSVGILTLNKPKCHNAFDEQLIAEITVGLQELESDERVRAAWCFPRPARASAPAPISAG